MGGGLSHYLECHAADVFAAVAPRHSTCSRRTSAADSNGCQSYGSCKGGVEVGLCTKQGGTHEPDNATVGWPFLKKCTLP
jgi:poly(3-hydroxybutyrate) depolymerase